MSAKQSQALDKSQTRTGEVSGRGVPSRALALAYDRLPIPVIAFVKTKTRIVYANQAAMGLFGANLLSCGMKDIMGAGTHFPQMTLKEILRRLSPSRDVSDVAIEVRSCTGQLLLAKSSFIMAHGTRVPVIALVDTKAMDLSVAVGRVAQELLTPGDTDQDLLAITTRARRLCGGDRAYLKLLDSTGQRLVYRALSSHVSGEVFPEPTSTISRGMTGEVMRSRTGRYIPDLRLEPAHAFVQGFADTISRVAVPLLDASSDAGCIGVLVVDGTRVDQFALYDVAVLQMFADFATLAIAQAELVATARVNAADVLKRQSRLYSIPEVSETIHGAKNMVRGLLDDVREMRAIAHEMPRGRQIEARLEEQGYRATSLLSILTALLKALPGVRQVLTGESAKQLRPERVDVGKLVREMARLLPSRDESSGVDLDLEAVESGHLVRAAREEILLLIYSLLSNAFNAMRRAGTGGRIIVTVCVGERLPEMVRLVVADEGPGLSRAEIASLRSGAYFTNTQGGTGLGLRGVRATVESLGGALAIDSQYGHGARVTVDLPRE